MFDVNFMYLGIIYIYIYIGCCGVMIVYWVVGFYDFRVVNLEFSFGVCNFLELCYFIFSFVILNCFLKKYVKVVWKN